MNSIRNFLAAVFSTPPDDVPPCVAQANSFREVVSLQALFVTLTVGLLAYVRSSPTFDLRVDLLFALLAALPLMRWIRENRTAGLATCDGGIMPLDG